MNHYQLIFDIQSDWHIGNGKEAGAYSDALALKDNHHLPYIPGKSIKGLLRHAFTIALKNNWFEEHENDFLNTLFGDESRQGLNAQGALQISSARLSQAECHFFNDHKTAIKHLYRVQQFTAIDHPSGVAKESSLRSMEVVIPMILTAQLKLNTQHPVLKEKNSILTDKMLTYLNQVVPLITELGAKRHRGLGKVYVSAQKDTKKGGKH